MGNLEDVMGVVSASPFRFSYAGTTTTDSTNPVGTPITYKEVLNMYHSVSGEKKMTIGGEQCHLCGAEKQEDTSYRSFSKKGKTKVEQSVTYRCGTTVDKSYWWKDSAKHDHTQSVTMGLECIL